MTPSDADRFSHKVFELGCALNAVQAAELRAFAQDRLRVYRREAAEQNVRERVDFLLALARDPAYPFERFNVDQWVREMVTAVLALTEGR